MADASQQKELNQPHPLIVDTHLRVNYPILIFMLLLGVVLLAILLISIKFAILKFNHPIILGFCSYSCTAIIMALSKRIMIPRIKSHISKFLTKHHNLSIEDQIVTLFSLTKRIAVITYLQEFAKILIRRGHKGITIRNCPTKDIVTIDPFNVTFEPLLLDEADETIRELDNTLNIYTPDTDSALPIVENYSSGMISPQLRRNIKIAGGKGMFIFILMMTLLMIVGAFITGQTFFLATIMIICLLMIIFGVRIGSTMGRRQWFIVPGGLIVREGKFFSQDCKLHLFDRSTSVLIVNKISKHQWSLYAAKKGSFQRAVVTRKESEILLRAWLSPLPPPPIEQLSDLM